eukprot:COSAG02_NODE_16640_length_1068_cov_0.864809_1_plen_170_part_10
MQGAAHGTMARCAQAARAQPQPRTAVLVLRPRPMPRHFDGRVWRAADGTIDDGSREVARRRAVQETEGGRWSARWQAECRGQPVWTTPSLFAHAAQDVLSTPAPFRLSRSPLPPPPPPRERSETTAPNARSAARKINKRGYAVFSELELRCLLRCMGEADAARAKSKAVL